ncbi:uncharacterized protein LOC123540514 [Mercenaria mercenaria]|uniref:uncharacterized protein LOC123540514 n=1 Tax=Mercenaria mercenaria TaxID=6596 RepID=UPI00234FA9E5|nr:uncharacterized protein LOC123540514 [Mercenaria mercenaria]XP_053383255.1 uncharacterized protein LOC123540514 [Mercenaria mercenaria]XP_053383256.1 uncharacterized protein LOC123540514 [Mercenaria mercenaria]
MNVDRYDSMLICDVCGKSFSRRNYLNQHLSIHADKKPYSCSVCFKKFLYKQTYEEHLERHARNKKVQCELCGKRFYNQRELKCHKKKHAVKGEFHCQVCDLYFVEEGSLQAHHNRLHVSYSCTYCSEKFPNKKEMKTHAFRQHKDKRKSEKEFVKTKKMVCQFCNKTLCNKWRLESHLIMQHKMEKHTIIEKGLLQFRRRKGMKNISENGNEGNCSRHESVRNVTTITAGGELVCKGSISIAELAIPITTVNHRKLQNIKYKDCFEGTDLNVFDAKCKSNFNIDASNGHSNIQYDVTIVSDSAHNDGTYKTKDNIVKKVNYDSARNTFTLENVQENCNKNSQSKSFCGDKALNNVIKTVDKTSKHHEDNLENSGTLSPQHHASFANDDSDSGSTCSVDLTETRRLVECDVTDSNEELQHEFDEIVDTDENNDSVQNKTNIADCHVRPSSEALQEYFARYNMKIVERNKDLTNVWKETDIRNSNIKTLDAGKRSTIDLGTKITTSFGKSLPAFQRISDMTRSNNEEELKKSSRSQHSSSYFVADDSRNNDMSYRDQIYCKKGTEARVNFEKCASKQEAMPNIELRNTAVTNQDMNMSKNNTKTTDTVLKNVGETSYKTESETCFKCPENPCPVTDKKRPRIYWVKYKNMPLSQKQTHVQTSKSLSEPNERPACAINRVTEIPLFDRRAENSSCTNLQNNSSQSINVRKPVPLIFRTHRLSNDENISSSSPTSIRGFKDVPTVIPSLLSSGYVRKTEISENFPTIARALSSCQSGPDLNRAPDDDACVSMSTLTHNKKEGTSPKQNDEMCKLGQNLSKLINTPGGEISNKKKAFIDEPPNFDQSLQIRSGEKLVAVPLRTDYLDNCLNKDRRTVDHRGSNWSMKDGESGNKAGLQEASEQTFHQKNTLYRKENVNKVYDQFADESAKSVGVSWPSESSSDQTVESRENISREENTKHIADLKESNELEIVKDSIKNKLNRIQHSGDYPDFLDEIIKLLQTEKERRGNKCVD